MNKRELSQLQRLINNTVRAQNAYYRHQAVLNNFCREFYGCEPGDIDADHIIDGVFGGCGVAPGMTADEFDTIMQNKR